MKEQFDYNKKEITINNNHYSYADLISTEVKTPKLLQNAGNEVLNAAANALSGSVANGNEQVNICIQFNFKNTKETITLNEKPVIRFSMDYHELVKKARAIQEDIKTYQQ